MNKPASEKIRSFRLKSRVKLCELAKASGVTDSYLSRVERGWHKPTKELINKLSSGYEKLGVNSTTWLLNCYSS